MENTECPKWIEFLKETILNQRHIKEVQEKLGLALTGKAHA